MAQTSHGARFLHEAGAQQRILRVPWRQRLDRHLPAQRFVHRQKHAAHAAAADFLQHTMPAQTRRQRTIGFYHAANFIQRLELGRQIRNRLARDLAVQEVR
jgi:hypothetical protein